MRPVVNFSLLAPNYIKVELVTLDVSMLDVIVQFVQHRVSVVRQSSAFLVWNWTEWLAELESIILHFFYHRDPIFIISSSVCLISFI